MFEPGKIIFSADRYIKKPYASPFLVPVYSYRCFIVFWIWGGGVGWGGGLLSQGR